MTDLVVRGGRVLLDDWVDGDLVIRAGIPGDGDPCEGYEEVDASRGRIRTGVRADLVLLTERLEVAMRLGGGGVVHRTR